MVNIKSNQKVECMESAVKKGTLDCDIGEWAVGVEKISFRIVNPAGGEVARISATKDGIEFTPKSTMTCNVTGSNDEKVSCTLKMA